MNTALLVGKKADQDAPDLGEALGEGYLLLTEKTCAGAERLLRSREDISALFLDEPSRQAGVRELLETVHGGLSSFRALPVLLVCDRDCLDEDSLLLGGPVADLVVKPVIPRILRNRLARAAERANSMTYRELTEILRLLPSNIYIKDARGRYIFSTEGSRSAVLRPDVPETDIIGRTDVEIRQDKENARRALEADLEIIRTGKGTSYVIQAPGQDGEAQYLQVIKEAIRSADGKSNRGIISLINNVTEQERLRKRLEKMSITDQLTGLYNRSYLDLYAAELFRRREDYPVSFISADCDGLKQVNDSLGHLAGDVYLRHAAALFRKALPAGSAIFRLGGDEFFAILPRMEAARAAALARTLEERAGDYRVGDLSLSVSVGCSTLLSPEEDFSACFKLADERMYEIKRRKKESP